MNLVSQRRAFTGTMSILATAFGVVISRDVLGEQADLFADVFKISALIFVGTAAASFVFWTLTHLRRASVFRGGIAGFLTALCLIPLPNFGWALKTEFLSKFQGGTEGFLSAIFSSIPAAINAGLYTFIDITKASLIAIAASVIIGGACAHFIPPKIPRHDENSQSPRQ